MTRRRVNIFVLLITLACISGLGVCLSSMVVFALPPNMTVQPGVSLPAHLTEGPVPTAYVVGCVFDEDGNPVPRAEVTLWQDGNLWQVGKLMLGDGNYNPHTTNIPNQVSMNNVMEGCVSFGILFPGDYTLTAEKDGCKSSPVRFHVGEDTMSPNQLEATLHEIRVNISLTGYHVPTFTPEQLSYTGAITGSIREQTGRLTPQANVSLWTDGHMVDAPDNPQASKVRNISGRYISYAFEHLAPGNYTVLAEYYGFGWNDSVSAVVGTDTVMAGIVSSHGFPYPTKPPDRPTVSPTSDPSPAQPTPALPGLVSLLVVGFVMCYIANKK